MLEFELPLRRVGETLEEQFPVLQEPAIALTLDSYCLCFFKERLSFWIRVIRERVVTLFTLPELAADSSHFAGMSQPSC